LSVTLAQLIGDGTELPQELAGRAVAGLTSDSREVKPGCIFAALPGTQADGASFIPAAIAAGAIAVIARPGTIAGVPVIADRNPRRLFALAAARFHGAQPDLVVAVTGTSGKTSVSSFVREMWTAMGFRAASLGTVGVVGPAGTLALDHTTPDPMKLHALAASLAADHVDHLVVEASSHGLSQNRLDGLRIAAAAFTNLSHDHLDYHASEREYFDAKMRLFEELLPKGAPAVINADAGHGGAVVERAKAAGLEVLTVGAKGQYLKLISVDRSGLGQRLVIEAKGRRHTVLLPLVGAFQASNTMVAAGLVMATGGEEEIALRAIESLRGAKGRLDLVARSSKGAPVFVDYSHKPDALENAIAALRPYASGRLHVVFGCGGDRDRGKRPIMGEIAARLADRVYVTDDNPRSENAGAIRAEILAACPGAAEIGDRAAAIRSAVDALGEGDVLLVAGKGHEEGQKIGKKVFPFSDHDAVRAAIAGRDYRG